MTEAQIKDAATREFAARLAWALWPEHRPPKENCRSEAGREGQSCRICEARVLDWEARVERIRASVVEVVNVY